MYMYMYTYIYIYISIGRRQAFKGAADQRFLPRRNTPIESDDEAVDAQATFQAAIHLFSYLPISLPICLSIYLAKISIYLSIHLSIYPAMTRMHTYGCAIKQRNRWLRWHTGWAAQAARLRRAPARRVDCRRCVVNPLCEYAQYPCVSTHSTPV